MCPTRQRKEHLRRRYTTAVHMPSPIHAKLAAEQNENTGKVLLLAFEAITVTLFWRILRYFGSFRLEDGQMFADLGSSLLAAAAAEHFG